MNWGWVLCSRICCRRNASGVGQWSACLVPRFDPAWGGGLLEGGGTFKMCRLVGGLRSVGVCPQRELWNSCFLAIMEGSKCSIAISFLHSHQPKTTGSNGHGLKLRNCELIGIFSLVEISLILSQWWKAYTPGFWNLVLREGTAPPGALVRLVTEVSSQVPVVSCCAVMLSPQRSWERRSCQTDIRDVQYMSRCFEKLNAHPGCTTQNHSSLIDSERTDHSGIFSVQSHESPYYTI